MLIREVERKIAEFSPQFTLESLRFLGNGTSSTAFLANEEWIFRFPQEVEEIQKTLEKEIALLPKLSEVLPVKIPQFQYIARNPFGSLIYVGYHMLPGVPLEKSVFESMEPYKQEQVLEVLASLLRSIHSFPVAIARTCKVEEEIYKGAYHPEQKCFLQEIRHFLTQEEIAHIESIFAAYERDSAN